MYLKLSEVSRISLEMLEAFKISEKSESCQKLVRHKPSKNVFKIARSL